MKETEAKQNWNSFTKAKPGTTCFSLQNGQKETFGAVCRRKWWWRRTKTWTSTLFAHVVFVWFFCFYALFPLCFAVFLTISLSDGGGLVGGAWVCVAFETPQMPPTVSGTGLRELSVAEAAFLGLASPALSTVRRKREGKGGSLDVWMQRAWTLKRHLIGHLI